MKLISNYELNKYSDGGLSALFSQSGRAWSAHSGIGQRRNALASLENITRLLLARSVACAP